MYDYKKKRRRMSVLKFEKRIKILIIRKGVTGKNIFFHFIPIKNC